MYSIKDILKKSFIEGYSANDISFKTVVLALVITAVISIYIFALYRIITRKTFYSKNFNISLVGVALITATIIITIQSSIVVSLGMVGALSIVRFRTAIKEPMDLMFLFWSISVGIVCGAGFAEFAVILTVLLTIVIMILEYLPVSKAPMILIVNAKSDCDENSIYSVLQGHSVRYKVKARNLTLTSMDMTIELRTNCETDIIREISGITNVTSVSIIEHDGEVTL